MKQFMLNSLNLDFTVNGVQYNAIIRNDKGGGLFSGRKVILLNATATQVLDEISTMFGGEIARKLASVSAETLEDQ